MDFTKLNCYCNKAVVHLPGLWVVAKIRVPIAAAVWTAVNSHTRSARVRSRAGTDDLKIIMVQANIGNDIMLLARARATAHDILQHP